MNLTQILKLTNERWRVLHSMILAENNLQDFITSLKLDIAKCLVVA